MSRRMRAAKVLCFACLLHVMPGTAHARDAAFLDPGSGGGGGGGAEVEDVRADPKSEVDIGETTIHSAKRETLFFANTSTMPVKVEKLTVNSDANVQADITNDDCSKPGTIAPQSKCSVEINITPTGAGSWSVEVLLTHNGAGRIAREHITGKTSGGSGGDKKETGLDMLSKEPTPINFGEVDVESKSAHSALMVNDSADPISIYSIDVIEADNGLKILEGGCEVDMELKAGQSCPVTLVWEPSRHGAIATDLIIRHSGRQGFAVIPVRGKTKGDEEATKAAAPVAVADAKKGSGKETIPPPMGADELEQAAFGKIPAVNAGFFQSSKPAMTRVAVLRLIGTVGMRAVLLLPDGSTKLAIAGDVIDMGDDATVKIVAVGAKSVDVMLDGKKKTLELGSSPELIAHAAAAEQSTQKTDRGETKGAKEKQSSPRGLTSTSVSQGSGLAPPLPLGAPILPAAMGSSPATKLSNGTVP